MRRGLHVDPEPATLVPFVVSLDDGDVVNLLALAWDERPDAIAAGVRAAPGLVVLLDSRHIMFSGVDQVHVGGVVHLDLVPDVRAAVQDRCRNIARWSEPFDGVLDVAFQYTSGTRALVTASALLAAKWASYAA